MSKYMAPELKKLLHSRELAQRRGDVSEEAKLCNVMGEFLKKEGDLAGALREHEMELQLCEATGDKMGVAIANRRVGECKSELGRHEEGLKHQKLHLRIAKSLGNLLEEQRALATIGRNCYLYALSLPEPESGRELECAKDALLQSLKCCDTLEANKSCSERDLREMKARLYSNLSNYYEHKDELVLAKRYCQKAISLSQSENFCCANFYISLGSICMTSAECSDALRHFESALKLSQREGDKPMQCFALEQMGTVFATLKDFNAAKHSWKQALKIGRITGEEKSRLQQNYMLVKKMLMFLDKLKCLGRNDIHNRMELFEKLGDTACTMELYRAGEFYYGEELELAEKSGFGGSKVGAICCSLAVTYTDLKEYDKAILYFGREIENCQEKVKCSSLKLLGDSHLEAGHEFTVIDSLYERAMEIGERERDLKSLKEVWRSRLKLYQREGLDRNILEARMEIGELSQELDSGESESEEVGTSNSRWKVFILSDSDISEEELEDIQEATSSVSHVRCPKKSNVDRVNAKGESKLQQAAIQGKLDMATILLKQGALVNTRDNCGWTPLHEACNFGNSEMARVLLEYGANVNDPGGIHCHGITPLHDAVLNGHYACTKILVGFGADPHLKNNDSLSPVDIARRELEECKVEKCAEELQERMNRIIQLLQNCPPPKYRPKQTTISFLPQKRPNLRSTSPPPFLPERASPESTQPWLVEDSEYRNKRPKMSPRFRANSGSKAGTSDPYTLTSPRKGGKGKGVVSRQLKTAKHLRKSPKRSNKKLLNSFLDSKTKESSPNSNLSPLQEDRTSEVDMFFGATVANDPTGLDAITPYGLNESDLPEFELSYSPTPIQTPQDMSPDRLSGNHSTTSVSTRLDAVTLQEVKRVRVRIESDQIKIPCPPGRTIQWLCEEAGERYSSLRGIRPLLQLTDKGGALLMPMDKLSEVLTNEEEVVGRVESWDLPSLRDRYQQYCTTHSVPPCDRILSSLPSLAVENELNLCNGMLPTQDLLHLFKCLSAQLHITRMDLSSNVIGDEGLRVLGGSICNLSSLQFMSLSCCSLSCVGISALLGQIVTQQTDRKPIDSLAHLDLSYNFICGDGGKALSHFISHTRNLQVLKLDSCGLKNCTEFNHLSNSISTLSHLKELSLAFNHIPINVMTTLLQGIGRDALVKLNLSHNNVI